MTISYLIYTSTSNSFFSLEELSLLWEKANSNNLKTGITGLLLYQEGIFMQMLEGDLDNILTLYDKIQVDSRHNCAPQPIIGEIPKRFFPNWSMGFKQIELGHDLPNLNVFLNYIDSLFIQYDKDKVDEILNFIFSYSKWSA